MPVVRSLKYGNPFSALLSGLNVLVLGVFALSCIYPLWYLFINSLSSPTAFIKGVFFLPVDLTFNAYSNLRNISGINSAIFISIARTVSGSLLVTLCSSFAAYIITRRNLPCRKLLYRFFIGTMYVGGGFIPYYLLINALHLRNNFLVYIVPGAVSAFNMILVKTYIEQMPGALWESAEIDGAGVMTIYWNIIIPLAKPILACLIIFAAVGQWNSWTDDLFFMIGSKAKDLHCLQFLLYKNLQQTTSAAVRSGIASAGAELDVTPVTLRMAMTCITVLPILCVYPFMQKYFSKGIMLGAIKG